MVEVTQQDRDAAEELAILARQLRGMSFQWKAAGASVIAARLSKAADVIASVSALKAEKDATEAQTVAEIVAWLREQWDDRLQSPLALANSIEQRAYK